MFHNSFKVIRDGTTTITTTQWKSICRDLSQANDKDHLLKSAQMAPNPHQTLIQLANIIKNGI
jgi:hypothetical protein